MGLLSHKVERTAIAAGDHIYTWRAVFAYSHHGIYVGGNKVVHFTCKHSKVSCSNSSLKCSNLSPGPLISVFASSSKVTSTCVNFPDCGFRQPESGVVISCLDCFLGDGSLYRFEYGVSASIFLAKLRGGTCTTADSDPPEAVIHRAMFLLHNGFGKYNVLENNCEDFALYCKTGLLIHDQGAPAPGTSGQAACATGFPLAAILSCSLKLFMSSPVGILTATAGMYYMSRYAADIGVRSDVIKVKVEDIALFQNRKRPKKELAEDNECCKEIPASKRQRSTR